MAWGRSWGLLGSLIDHPPVQVGSFSGPPQPARDSAIKGWFWGGDAPPGQGHLQATRDAAGGRVGDKAEGFYPPSPRLSHQALPESSDEGTGLHLSRVPQGARHSWDQDAALPVPTLVQVTCSLPLPWVQRATASVH